MSNGEMHISSFILRCLPDQLASIAETAASLTGVEIHGRDPSGKLVALLELDSEEELVGTIDRLEQIPGVINASMVYHHVE